MKSVFAVSLLVLLPCCSVAVLDDAAPVHSQNECSADDECGDGVCEGGACRATEGGFRTLLLEVTAPADARTIAGVRFLKHIDNLDPRGGVQDVVLDRVAQVTGYVHAEKAADQSCTFPTSSVPARVTFTPTQPLLGVSPGVYTTTTRFGNVVTGGGSEAQEHVFELSLPPGEYDLYVQDVAQVPAAENRIAAAPVSCRIVPKLIRRVHIEAGKVLVPVALNAPAKLDVTVQWPAPGTAQDLSGWRIDMLEPAAGKVISSEAVLGQPTDNRYTTTLHYFAAEGEAYGHEFVRLTPPETSMAPVIVLERGALELFARGEALIDQLRVLPSTVRFQGRIEKQGSSAPVAASLSLVAQELDQIEPGTLASFRRTLETDADGRFEVELLPGKYQVHAIPSAASGAAAVQTELEIGVAPGFQAGKVIEVKDLARLEGRVQTPSGRPVLGASIHAVATPSGSLVGLLDAALGAQPWVPRASACSGRNQSCIPVTETDGYFSIEADPGVFDMSVRTPDDAGFAWLVRPQLAVTEQWQDLGQLTLPLPVLYRGTITAAETGLVPGALIRAYIYVDAGGNVQNPTAGSDMNLKSVLQVAETRARDDGTFELRLPARLQ
ncbi:MAG TPA: hypothetical protein VK524_05180 [Polyangiaceae bacterium]|nr:hypothetical protein [Polyangiaceae bacterium]